MKHKWWHFIYGTDIAQEIISKGTHFQTSNFCTECKKCGEQVGEKYGGTTFGLNLKINLEEDKVKMFTCNSCNQTFQKGWSDEEANKEGFELFGVKNAIVDQDMALVCDDCFNAM